MVYCFLLVAEPPGSKKVDLVIAIGLSKAQKLSRLPTQLLSTGLPSILGRVARLGAALGQLGSELGSI